MFLSFLVLGSFHLSSAVYFFFVQKKRYLWDFTFCYQPNGVCKKSINGFQVTTKPLFSSMHQYQGKQYASVLGCILT